MTTALQEQDGATNGARLFNITGVASPDLPLRVLNLFAQQDLAFERVTVARVADRYVLSIEHRELQPDKADIIAAKIGAFVLVDSVEMVAVP